VNVRGGPELHWSLTLYVSGASSHSVAAIRTVQAICDGELEGRADLEIIDVTKAPPSDMSHIYAIPTLVKRTPEPVRYLVGELTDAVRVREGLDLGPAAPEGEEP
jgi:circadian clock protein KaiB